MTRGSGAAHPDLAQTLDDYAAMLRAVGDLAAVRPLVERALKIREAAFGPDHERVAQSLHNLGITLYMSGDYVAARAPYERALEGLGPYVGHHGIRSWWEESFAALPDLAAELFQVRDLGALTLAHGRLRGTGAESGASFERTLWLAAEWRNRKVVWWYAFASEAEALEAVGLRE